ncbi:MAG: UDP-N-acetylmuramoyl-tripeptide--D-alanyl-D-alanine ligase [Bacteroidetes bacterium]|nr:MAG: UDP-N-acetylmuramoyl-tripeptide--D-alanyl-D-alanine ligase [Bacteroidota bacterium]
MQSSLTSRLLELYHLHPSVSTDTRTVKEGDLFFALRGDTFNGNAYAAAALEKGAAFAVIDDPDVHLPEDPRYILTENTLLALQDLARARRRTLSIPFLGITGSNGKTTSKELIFSVLNTAYKASATRGNLNNHIGVPLTLLAIPPDTEIAVIEMGANKPGDIRELVEIAEPTHGLITNVGFAHIEQLGGLEGVRVTKGALFDFCREHEGFIFVNEADPHVALAAGDYPRRSSYGAVASDYHYTLLHNSPEGMELEVSSPRWTEAARFRSQLTGEYNCMNILAAIAVGEHFGVSLDQIREGIYQYVPANNRSQLVKKGHLQIWMDAYNANPSSMRASVANAFSMQKGRTALILGDMLELGEQAVDMHTAMGAFVNTFTPAIVIGVGPLMKHMIEEIEAPHVWFPNAVSAIPEVAKLLQEVDFVLIKGSRGIALEKLAEAI